MFVGNYRDVASNIDKELLVHIEIAHKWELICGIVGFDPSPILAQLINRANTYEFTHGHGGYQKAHNKTAVSSKLDMSTICSILNLGSSMLFIWAILDI